MARIDGTRWWDALSGTNDGDEIHGFEGDDYIAGEGGNDTLRGDGGNDIIYGGSGHDDIQGGSGDDLLMGESGNDTIVATSGVDEIHGGDGDDDITVEGGDWFRFDHVYGGSGDDTIEVISTKLIAFGGSGNDTFFTDLADETILVGGAGSDRFILTDNDLFGGRVAELHGGEAAVLTSDPFGVESISSVTLGGDTSVDTLDLSHLDGVGTLRINMATGTITDDESDMLCATFDGIENVVGSSATDVVWGNGADNTLEGRGGDDWLTGGGGSDLLRGGAGIDALFGNSGQDWLHGDSGDDTVDGGSNSDIVIGGTGRDTLYGGSGDDSIFGEFYGDAVAADTLTGGDGADRFVFVNVANNVTATEIATRTGGTMYQLNITPIFDTITDFDTTGTVHDTLDLSYIMQTRAGFGGTFQQAVDRGILYFVQHGTPGQADFGTKVMIDLNGGAHTDTLNNYVVADLAGISQAEVANRPDLFLV